jgi:hypothetical protein
MDLPRWDEALYMGKGEKFLYNGTLGAISGSPFYVLLYSIFVKVFGTVGSIYYMQYFVKISVSLLFFLFLVGYLQSSLLALVLTLVWVLSGVNIRETVLVYHVALALFLLTLIALKKHRYIAFILLCLCTLTRLEYIFPTAAFGVYLTFDKICQSKDYRLKISPSKIAITPWLFIALLLLLLMLFILIMTDKFNPGTHRLWFAFNQNYARHEVESGRYKLNPYLDSNIVVQNDFPGANSLTGALSTNPRLFLNHISRNIIMLPKAMLSYTRPYTSSLRSGLLYGILLGFIITLLIQTSVDNFLVFYRKLFSSIRKHRIILYLTGICMTSLIPILFVYPLPHHTIIMAPLLLFWIGLICTRTLNCIASPNFMRVSLINLNLLFFLFIFTTGKPYSMKSGERKIYQQVTQLIKVWPKEKVKLMGVGASWYASYIGSQKVLPIEPFATVYGGKIENAASDLRGLIEKYHPDAVLVNNVLMNSKNFDTGSLEILYSDQWVRYPIGTDNLYFLGEKFKQ